MASSSLLFLMFISNSQIHLSNLSGDILSSMKTTLCPSLSGFKENSTLHLFDSRLYIFDSVVKKSSASGTIYHIIDYNTNKHYAVKQIQNTSECNGMKQTLKEEYDIMLQMKHNYNNNSKALFPFPYNYCYNKQNNVCLLQMDFITTAEHRDDIFNILNKMVDRRYQISIQLIIETLMNCFDQINDTLSILHSFNAYTNDMHPWNILYSYSNSSNNIQCHLIDYASIFIIQKGFIHQTHYSIDQPQYYRGEIRLSAYAYYHLLTPEKRRNQSIEILNKYALLDDTYNLAVIIIGELVKTLVKYHKFWKNDIVKDLHRLKKRTYKLETQMLSSTNKYVLPNIDYSKLCEAVWKTFNSIVHNIDRLLKHYSVNMNKPVNKQFERLLQSIAVNYEWIINQTNHSHL